MLTSRPEFPTADNFNASTSNDPEDEKVLEKGVASLLIDEPVQSSPHPSPPLSGGDAPSNSSAMQPLSLEGAQISAISIPVSPASLASSIHPQLRVASSSSSPSPGSSTATSPSPLSTRSPSLTSKVVSPLLLPNSDGVSWALDIGPPTSIVAGGWGDTRTLGSAHSSPSPSLSRGTPTQPPPLLLPAADSATNPIGPVHVDVGVLAGVREPHSEGPLAALRRSVMERERLNTGSSGVLISAAMKSPQALLPAGSSESTGAGASIEQEGREAPAVEESAPKKSDEESAPKKSDVSWADERAPSRKSSLDKDSKSSSSKGSTTRRQAETTEGSPSVWAGSHPAEFRSEELDEHQYQQHADGGPMGMSMPVFEYGLGYRYALPYGYATRDTAATQTQYRHHPFDRSAPHYPYAAHGGSSHFISEQPRAIPNRHGQVTHYIVPSATIPANPAFRTADIVPASAAAAAAIGGPKGGSVVADSHGLSFPVGG